MVCNAVMSDENAKAPYGVLTIGRVQARIALHILGCECLNDTINLLCLTRKANVHEQLPNRDV